MHLSKQRRRRRTEMRCNSMYSGAFVRHISAGRRVDLACSSDYGLLRLLDIRLYALAFIEFVPQWQRSGKFVPGLSRRIPFQKLLSGWRLLASQLVYEYQCREVLPRNHGHEFKRKASVCGMSPQRLQSISYVDGGLRGKRSDRRNIGRSDGWKSRWRSKAKQREAPTWT